MSEWRVVCKDTQNLKDGPIIWLCESFDRAEEQIKLVYGTRRYNSWTFLIQNRNRDGSWSSMEAWTIGDYLDGETNWMK
jgi:hypothetical protein